MFLNKLLEHTDAQNKAIDSISSIITYETKWCRSWETFRKSVWKKDLETFQKNQPVERDAQRPIEGVEVPDSHHQQTVEKLISPCKASDRTASSTRAYN